MAAAIVSSPASVHTQGSHTIRKVQLIDHGTASRIGDAVCAVMRAPRSYTGEDVVELSCHGAPALLAMVVERLCERGARLATPGEFTRRAFLNGRIELAQAEGVALLVSARTERAVVLAARALDGELGRHVHALREAILDLVAGLEVTLDFPDEGVEIAHALAREKVRAAARDADALIAAARRGRLLYDGLTVAITGRPNAGKSSLFNMLLGNDRAIVSPTPGTTRDVIEATIDLRGVPVRLLDTAGLAEPTDAIEAEGMRRTAQAIQACDVAIVVVDGSVAPQQDDTLHAALGGQRTVCVLSKADLGLHPAVRKSPSAIAVSSTSGAGVAALLDRLAEEAARASGGEEEGDLVASLRQHEGLERISRSLNAACDTLGSMPLEAVLVDLREALIDVSQLLGVDLGDAILDRVFATFCIGK